MSAKREEKYIKRAQARTFLAHIIENVQNVRRSDPTAKPKDIFASIGTTHRAVGTAVMQAKSPQLRAAYWAAFGKKKPRKKSVRRVGRPPRAEPKAFAVPSPANAAIAPNSVFDLAQRLAQLSPNERELVVSFAAFMSAKK